jgi:hypothetical protein
MKSFYSLAILFLITFVFISGSENYTSAKKSIAELGIIPMESTINDKDVFSTHRFNVVPGENLEVSTSGGSITVTGTDNNEAVVKMFVRRNNRFLQPSDTDLRNFEIKIEKSGNKIIASAKRLQSNTNILRPNNESISFEVSVPRNFQVNVNTSGGSIRLGNLEGEISGRTSGGSIRLNNLEGIVDVRTSGGSITIDESSGDISARTRGGSVTASNSDGVLDLSTSGGSVRLDNLSGEISASTSGGSIRANITSLSGDVSLRTSGGSISATLPRGLGLNLNLRGNSVRVPLENFSGESKRNEIVGAMNGGGYNVTMRTSGGGVTIGWQ